MLLFIIGTLTTVFCEISNYNLLIESNEHLLRTKRDGIPSTRWISRKGGIDIPITLRSLITCLTPGLNDLICLGPRVGILEPRDITLTNEKGASFGYNNGVDLRFLEPLNLPLINDQTNVGHHIGATVNANKVEFGPQLDIFKTYRHNIGGVVEYDTSGAAVDIGQRISIANDLVKIRITDFGINISPFDSTPPYNYPYQQGIRNLNWRHQSSPLQNSENPVNEVTLQKVQSDELPFARGLKTTALQATTN